MASNKRFLILLPFLAFSFLGSLERDDPAQAYFVTDFACIGSFETGCPDYELTGTVTPIRALLKIKERMVVKTMDGTVVKTQNKSVHQIIKNQPYTLTFTLPFKTSLTNRGLNILIEFINDSGTTVHSFSFNIKPVNPGFIIPRFYINDYYIIEDIVVDPDNYSTNRYEKIRFDQTYDYFDVDNYYRLPLDNTFITYECGLTFPGCTAHLHFTDYLKIFPYLDSDEEVPSFDIPLRTIVKKNGVSFAFPSVMYVNSKTLEMSLEARPGFIQTHYFYLPKNRSEELLDQNFVLDIRDFGYGKTSFMWEIKYTNNHHLIGDCSDSDYCVIGESGNG